MFRPGILPCVQHSRKLVCIVRGVFKGDVIPVTNGADDGRRAKTGRADTGVMAPNTSSCTRLLERPACWDGTSVHRRGSRMFCRGGGGVNDGRVLRALAPAPTGGLGLINIRLRYIASIEYSERFFLIFFFFAS